MRTRMLCVLLCFSLNSFAGDPFDKNQRLKNNALPTVDKIQKATSTKCPTEQNAVAQHTPFNRLKVVGIIQHKTYKQLLLNDDEKQVFSAVIGDSIAQEQLKLHQINKHEVQFTRRQQDCSAGEIVSVKF